MRKFVGKLLLDVPKVTSHMFEFSMYLSRCRARMSARDCRALVSARKETRASRAKSESTSH